MPLWKLPLTFGVERLAFAYMRRAVRGPVDVLAEGFPFAVAAGGFAIAFLWFEIRQSELFADMVTTGDRVVARIRKAVDNESLRRFVVELDRERTIFGTMIGTRCEHLAAGDFTAEGFRDLVERQHHAPPNGTPAGRFPLVQLVPSNLLDIVAAQIVERLGLIGRLRLRPLDSGEVGQAIFDRVVDTFPDRRSGLAPFFEPPLDRALVLGECMRSASAERSPAMRSNRGGGAKNLPAAATCNRSNVSARFTTRSAAELTAGKNQARVRQAC